MKNNNDFVEIFERRLSDYTGAPYVVAVDRCTNAILLALEVLGNRTATIGIPRHTYLSVPMTLLLHGYRVAFEDREWHREYEIGDTGVWDSAVGFRPGMYIPGRIQCLSFQQKKTLAIGKGGAILLDDFGLYSRLKRMRHDGRDSGIPLSSENLDDICMGYHMYMSPDEAARGILLLNQLSGDMKFGGSADYPDISGLKCFRNYI
jgi:dTDP-4-amino-4,6-dideoxygalactose transaminase